MKSFAGKMAACLCIVDCSTVKKQPQASKYSKNVAKLQVSAVLSSVMVFLVFGRPSCLLILNGLAQLLWDEFVYFDVRKS